MKRLQLVILFVLVLTKGLSQTEWVTTVIGANVYVKFPQKPEYKLTGKIGSYTASDNNCLFMASTSFDVIPNYGEFVKLPESQQMELIEALLDNTVKGILTQAGDEGIASKAFKIGDYSGREVSYNFMNPITGKKAEKRSKLFYKLNAIYVFQTFSLTEEVTCKEEQSAFLSSIIIK
jgi:hypothetical protein